MTNYVLGFMFNPERDKVVLIEKNRPEWQAGKLNGVGGKVEQGETPLQAMIREFYEETGINQTEWQYLTQMVEDNVFAVDVFYCFSDQWSNYRSMTDETVTHIYLADMPEYMREGDMLSNIGWLTMACLDRDVNNGRLLIDATYS